MKMKTNFFENLDFDYGERCVIFLDIDGTLVPDGEWNLDEAVLKAINNCKRKNEVYLCTNSFNNKRNAYIEKISKLPMIWEHRKPSRKILAAVPNKFRMLKRVVIGDKVLTDGLFAYRIGAKFVKVKRKVGKDRMFIRLYNLIDDCAFFILNRVL